MEHPGDTNHFAITSSSFTLMVKPPATKTALQATVAQLTLGQPLKLTASVASSLAPSTPRIGIVTFKDGATVLNTIALNGSSTAPLTFNPSTIGTHNYTASYSGDSNFLAGNSAIKQVKVS